MLQGVSVDLFQLVWYHTEQRWQGQLSSSSNEITASMAGQSQGLYYKEESAIEVEWWRKVRKIFLWFEKELLLHPWKGDVGDTCLTAECLTSLLGMRKSDLSTLIKFIKLLLVDKTSYLNLDW